jgi:hypothetical protein
MALFQGGRGLPGGCTLAQFLEEHFGVRNRMNLPNITEEWICERAKVHRERTGKLPTKESGQLLDAPNETWNAIYIALRRGRRGLPGGSSMSKLLKKYFEGR